MYLTSTNLVHYLLAHGHVTRHDVVHRPFSIYEIDGHHRGFHVDGGGGLFVKQLKAPSQAGIDCLRREALCYRLAWSDPKCSGWRRLLPRLISYDSDRHVVIVQRIAGAEHLLECYRRLKALPLDVARLLGHSLGEFHTAVQTLTDIDDEVFRADPPWIFRFHLQHYQDAVPAEQQLADAVRSDQAMARQLADLHTAWPTTSMIHGDLKWGNCLISPTVDDRPRLHLVDWELAQRGDPLWDTAGALASYLAEAVLQAGRDSGEQLEAFGNPTLLAKLHPPMAVLWQAYCNRVDLVSEPRTEHAASCMRYLGARILSTIIEYHFAADQLGALFAPLFATSRALLCDPTSCAVVLLGEEAG